MTRYELNRFRAILKVAELERLIRHRDGIIIERSRDQSDEIRSAPERALAVSKLDHECNQLQDARASVLRMRETSFGRCQECAEHPKRLAAVPWASYCIRCQEALDRKPEQMQPPSGDLLASAA